jgi:hypothetical protein
LALVLVHELGGWPSALTLLPERRGSTLAAEPRSVEVTPEMELAHSANWAYDGGSVPARCSVET